ncbi:hypothetical protein TEA_028507 [Camellia sinensis var. sinensis]|uniref:Mitochondrial import inner membrane translocase subunit TIM50 n=1 Tax=Camellia sinensis var. sinensis TaxID=542762 RepID=A0A4S4ER83_CAMSN|nr:hypothetical protein TEA_028507 [Camellia sinensis var. sinensis]
MDITSRSSNNTSVGRVLGNPPLLSFSFLSHSLAQTFTISLSRSLSRALPLQTVCSSNSGNFPPILFPTSRILHHQPVHQTWRQFFSPTLESNEVHGEPEINNDAGSNEDLDPSILGADDSDDNSKSSSEYQTCIVSNFYISDMIVAGLPIEGNSIYDDITEASCLIDYKFDVPSTFFDVAKEYMIQPFLEDTMEAGGDHDGRTCKDTIIDSDDLSLYLAIHQLRSCNEEPDVNPYLEHCEDADFSFPVFFNMKEHRVYVKQRHYLQMFLERVAEMFEIVVFTASQSIYAEQLLDIMDPDRKLISRRAYRESCIFLDGSYTEDLTVLDLRKGGKEMEEVGGADNPLKVKITTVARLAAEKGFRFEKVRGSEGEEAGDDNNARWRWRI